MNYSNLQNLLNQYDEKHNKAIISANLKKENLYVAIPELRDIDIKINDVSINKIKLILSSQNYDSII